MADIFKRQNYRPWDDLEKLAPKQHDTNRTQIRDKQDTNREQSGHNLPIKHNTNQSQTGHKDSDILGNSAQTGHATEHKGRHKANTNRIQTRNKPDTIFNFPSFVGVQKEILILFYSECKNQRNKITRELTLEYIANTLKIKVGSVKTSIKRLEEKQAIKRIKFKNGRGGWSQYELVNYIYQEIMEYETAHKLDTIWTQIGNKLNTQPDTQPDTIPSSSSNININKTTTTDLPPEWQEIDLSELHKRNIRFTLNHLLQYWPCLEDKCAVDFQDSIDGLVFDLDNGHITIRRSPLHLLISVIREGGLYVPSDKYQSAHRQAAIAMTAQHKTQQEEVFIAWVERNAAELSKQLETVSISLSNDFMHRGKDSMDWIKKNIYKKMDNKNKI